MFVENLVLDNSSVELYMQMALEKGVLVCGLFIMLVDGLLINHWLLFLLKDGCVINCWL